MEQQSLYSLICTIYQELYKQVSLNRQYKFTPHINDKKLICSFIGWVKAKYKSEIGVDFLIHYFEYQFSRYIGVRTPHGRNSVMINWIVGNKARTCWEQRDVNKGYYTKWKINRELGLDLKKAFKDVREQKAINAKQAFLVDLNPSEEYEKSRHFNTEVGFLYCADMTTMYNPKSRFCNECNFAVLCKERLNLNYPQVYKLRITTDL